LGYSQPGEKYKKPRMYRSYESDKQSADRSVSRVSQSAKATQAILPDTRE